MFVVGDAASQNFHLAATSDQETYFLHVSDVSKLQVASKLGCLTTKGPEVAWSCSNSTVVGKPPQIHNISNF